MSILVVLVVGREVSEGLALLRQLLLKCHRRSFLRFLLGHAEVIFCLPATREPDLCAVHAGSRHSCRGGFDSLVGCLRLLGDLWLLAGVSSPPA